MARLRHIIATMGTLAALGALPASSAGQTARMIAELRPDRIYYGTEALLLVEVSGASDADWPAVEPVEGLTIQHYRTPNVVRDLLSGRVTFRYQYRVTPERPGRFTLPSVSLDLGGTTLRQGPLTLDVVEAALKFHTIEIDPPAILVGGAAQLQVYYEGVRPGVQAVVPEIDGLAIRAQRSPRVELLRRQGLPVTIHTFAVNGLKLGTYRIAGITFDGVPAEPVTLSVVPFVVERTEVGERSLVVGSQTTAHVMIRGLPQTSKLNLVAPRGIKVAPARDRYRAPMGVSLFSFDLTPTEPGEFSIERVKLPDETEVPLPDPITLSVRQAGEGGILACRGIPRSEETVVGEPFIVDYEAFFRGDFRGAAIDLSQAGFADKDHIRVEPVNDLSYPDWPSQRIQVQMGDGRAIMLSGSGEFNGQKEQLLRFALRITPLAAGELSLDGLKVVVGIQVTRKQQTAFSVFQSTTTERFEREAETPPHGVTDPPGITRPPGYRGAVGTSLAFTTELDRTTATAMSPLTLTMRIRGDTVGPQFPPPPLMEVPELTRHFEVSPTVTGGEVEGDTITFSQVVRPRSEEVAELPALPLVYYDYTKKAYQTGYSLPIPLEINPGRLVGAGAMDVARAAAAPGDPAHDPDRETPGAIRLGANHTSLGPVAPGEPLGAVRLACLLFAGPACMLLAWAGQRFHRRWRPAAAVRQERKGLAQKLGTLGQGDGFHVRLADVVQSYLRLTFDLPPGEITPAALAGVLDGATIPAEVREETEALLHACDIGRFASGGVGDDERRQLTGRARRLLSALEQVHR